MNHSLSDSDKRKVQAVIDEVTGDRSLLKNNRGLEKQARSHGMPLKPMLLGLARLGEAEDATQWNWEFAVLTTGTLVAGGGGSDNLGLCVVASGTVAGEGDCGLVYYHVKSDGSRALIFVPIRRGDVVVKITSAAAGGGKYNGRMLGLPATNVAATGNLSESELGTLPGSDNAIILNMMEIGQNTHDLTDAANTFQFYFVGSLRQVNTDGKYIVAINGFFMGCDDDDDEIIDGGGA